MREMLVLSLVAVAIIGIAAGRLPRLRMDRSTIAFAGAVLVVAAGGIGLPEALASIDAGTIVLLFSMMVLVANLKLSGFFPLVSNLVLRAARTPRSLLAAIIAASGILSALFLNDTMCIVLTPLVVEIALGARRDPVPYLVGLAVSANVGSCATIIGNPQNMLVGSVSGVGFLEFFLRLAVPSGLGLLVCWLVVVLVFPAEFRRRASLPLRPLMRVKAYKPLLAKSLAGAGGMLALFLAGVPVPLAAAAAAAFLLMTRRVKPERIFAHVDFSLLVFFSGLFVLTAAVERTEAFRSLLKLAGPAVGGSLTRFSALTVAISNLISNVPAVLALKNFTAAFPLADRAWLALAMASTFAGNLTLLGSVANLIVAENARRYGVKLSFVSYLKAGLPITLITVAMGTAWLSIP